MIPHRYQLKAIERAALEENKSNKPVTDDAAPYLKSIIKQLDQTYGVKKK